MTAITESPTTPVISRKNQARRRSLKQSPSDVLQQKKQQSLTSFFKSSAAFEPMKIEKPSKEAKRNTPHRTPLKSVNTKKKTQMVLNLGQSDLEHINCPKCGMLYWSGNAEDAAVHKKMCESFHQHQSVSATTVCEPLKCKGWKQERLVERVGLMARIISIQPNDPKPLIKKADEVRHIIESELGCVALTKDQKKIQTTYLYIDDDKIVGCLIAQHISSAFRIIVSNIELSPSPDTASDKEAQQLKLINDLRAAEDAMNTCDTTQSVPAVLGVSRIWTHKNYRKKGIAVRLLDAARKSLVFGYNIPKEKVAFSQPTTDGKLLAMKYSNTKQFLVFTE